MPPFRALFYAATLGGALFAVHSVLRGPPALLVSTTSFALYILLLLGGLFRLRWRIFVDAVTAGPKTSRGVALTFEGGPDPATTPYILSILQKHEVTATFFVLAEKAEAYPELVRRMIAEGHALGVQAYRQPRFYLLTSERSLRRDLAEAVRSLEAITGARPTWFRPPLGVSHPGIARAALALDLTVVGWSLSARDGLKWAHEADVLGRVRRDAKDGAIVRLHCASDKGTFVPAGVKALPDLLTVLDEMRLPVVPLAPWVDAASLD